MPKMIDNSSFFSAAHCDSKMTDNGHMVVSEREDVSVVWKDEQRMEG
jgi:hypothetical protein